MLVIGYGIAVVIVLVLLVVFNVRSTSKRSQAGKGAKKTEPIVLETDTSIRQEASTKDVIEPAVIANSGQHRMIPERSGKNDQGYRNALRDMRMGAGQAMKAPESNKDTGKMPDSDYRNAMRNLQKSNDKKGKD
jgi:hypothetical protein